MFFSRTAGAEQLVKPFGPQGKKVHQALISHSYQTASQSGLPIYWLTEEQQVGDTFGERLANAYEALFAKGYKSVIAIGNDCPSLKVQDINQATDLLATTDWVLGPALDGGLYLLGLNSSVYNRQDFIALAWEKNDLLLSLQSYVSKAQQAYSSLQIKTDTDSKAVLIDCLSSLDERHPLCFVLCLLFSPQAERLDLISFSSFGGFYSSYCLRAPPIAV